jgi:hypothetical protein
MKEKNRKPQREKTTCSRDKETKGGGKGEREKLEEKQVGTNSGDEREGEGKKTKKYGKEVKV